jgi:hypothetical protein
MTTFTEIAAAVVMHSSALAFSHFGVTLEPDQTAKPQQPVAAAERVVARTPQRRALKLSECPQAHHQVVALHKA